MRRVALALAAFSLLGAGRPAGLGDVVSVHHWTYPEYTRVVIELTRPTSTEGRELPPDPAAGAPARLFFDLPGVWAGRRFDEPIPVGDGLLRRVRVGQNTPDTARVVLDLERCDHHRVRELAAPDRLVIDVFGPRPTARRREHRSALARALPTDLRPVRTIVLDPGHGGSDPGAIGVGGLREKDVTLALARLLRKRLAARGFAVVMTRDGDASLSLLDRTALAEGAGGDVFVSIHANAAPRSALSGVEIYTLDENSERQTLRVAARENGVAPREVDPLQRLLARLRLSEVSTRSERLADLVHGEILSNMGARWPSVRGPGRKHGPFYVLYLSDMPAILVEAGFVTHRGDARLLRDPEYLGAMADQIADALTRFRAGSRPVVAERAP
jgi:N-acetylmuramoyl-L-alanine amidase